MLLSIVHAWAQPVISGSIEVPSVFKKDFTDSYTDISLIKKITLNKTDIEEIFGTSDLHRDGIFNTTWSHGGSPDLEWRGPVLQLANEFVVLWPRVLPGQAGSYQFRLVAVAQLWNEQVAGPDGNLTGTIILAVRRGNWVQANKDVDALADLLQTLISFPRRPEDPIIAYARDLLWSLYRDICNAAVTRYRVQRNSITADNSVILRGWLEDWRNVTTELAKDPSYPWRALTCGDPQYTFARVANMPANVGWPDTTLPSLPDSEFPKDNLAERRAQLLDDVRPILSIIVGRPNDTDPLPDLTPIVPKDFGESWGGKETSAALKLFLSDVAGKDPEVVLNAINARRLELVLNGLMQLGRKLAPP